MKKFAQKITEHHTPAILKIIGLGHPKFESLAEKAFLDCTQPTKRLLTQIQSVKMTAAKHGIVSLSSVQLGIVFRFFVIRQNLTYNQWYYDHTNPDDYEVFLNPELENTSKLLEVQWEECPSFPFQMYKVKRNESVKVKYLNHDFNVKEEEFSCFKARLFQHELDHLNGRTLASQEVCNGLFKENNRLQQMIKDDDYEGLQEAMEYADMFDRKIKSNERIIESIEKLNKTQKNHETGRKNK